MKRIIATILAIISLFSLAACGKTNDGSGSSEKEKTAETGSKDGASKKKNAGSKKNGSAINYSIEETTVVDQDGVSVKATSIEHEGFLGDDGEDLGTYIIKLSVENNREDEINVYSQYVVVNGYVVEAYGSQTVNAGKKATMEINIDQQDLDFQNISEMDQIDLHMNVRNGDADVIYSGVTSLFPTGKKAEDIKVADRVTEKDECVILDTDECFIVILGEIEAPDYSDDYTLLCYAENKTDKGLKASFDDTYVNDYAIYSYGYVDLPAATRGYFYISFDGEEMEENNVTDVESIDMKVSVYDSNFDDIAETTVVFVP